MKKLNFIVIFPLLFLVSCSNNNLKINAERENFSTSSPQLKFCDPCANQTVYWVYALKSQSGASNKTNENLKKENIDKDTKGNKNNNEISLNNKSPLAQNVIHIINTPMCTCNNLPQEAANYFVTYEPLNDYPITYKAKYIETCTCY